MVSKIVGALIGASIANLFLSLLLQYSTAFVTKIKLPYRSAYLLSLGGLSASLLFTGFSIYAWGGPTSQMSLNIIRMIICNGVNWFVCANFIKDAQGNKIGAFIGLLIAAVNLALGFLVVGALLGIGKLLMS